MENKYCQSCGMPMGAEDDVYGTNADGSRNEDYCKYCFDQGAFTSECTMDEMIEFCVPHMVEAKSEKEIFHSDVVISPLQASEIMALNSGMTEEKARTMMKEFFPHLKRWK